MKTIMDAVHGTLCIPRRYCSDIIDTELFQRLKRVEQTFASSIFPTATHNRFMHSLGVFHIGKQLFEAIEKNSIIKSIQGTLENDSATKTCILRKASDSTHNVYEVLRESYYIACLLHDCGHAPFSHTFENFYLLPESNDGEQRGIQIHYAGVTNDIKKLRSSLDLIFGSSQRDAIIDDFIKDIESVQKEDGERIKAHEYVSAWLVLHPNGFLPRITSSSVYADPLLVCRMIMGVPYATPSSHKPKQEVKVREILNCYISLLNGNAIDADRIDYAARDQWAMGVRPSTLNLGRLLSSIHIEDCNKTKKFEVVYTKQALTELRSLSKTKNYSAYWVFNHHKFKLLEDSLVHAVRYLAVLINPDIRAKYEEKLIALTQGEVESTDDIDAQLNVLSNKALRSLFDYHSYVRKNIIGSEVIVQLCDDDITSMLKRYAAKGDDASETPLLSAFRTAYKEWYSRENLYITVWKSYSEYVHIFKKKCQTVILRLYKGNPQKKVVQRVLKEQTKDGLAIYQNIFKVVLKKIFAENISNESFRMIAMSRASYKSSKVNALVKIKNQYVSSCELFLPDNGEGIECEPYFYLYVEKSMMQDINEAETSHAIADHILASIENLSLADVEYIFAPSSN